MALRSVPLHATVLLALTARCQARRGDDAPPPPTPPVQAPLVNATKPEAQRGVEKPGTSSGPVALAPPLRTPHGSVARAPAPQNLAEVPAPAPATPPEAQSCTATLVVRQTQGASGCFIDERVTRQPGTLRYPCAGGDAVAAFGASRFTGTVRGGVVELSLRTRFHFTDGCDWGTTQRIAGALGTRRLVFTYTEAPLPAQSGCAAACRAVGEVGVQ